MASLAVRIVAKLLWIYSFVTLALVLALTAFPAVMLVRWAWQTETFWGWTAPDLAHLFLATVSVTLGYFLMGITMMVALPVLRILMGARTGAGRVPLRSFRVWSWYNYNGLILAWQTLFGKFFRSSSLYVFFLRAMGAKIGRHVIVNSNVVYDHDMLTIGDRTVIGGDAAIIGHVGEKGHLVREPITIGSDCTIGQYTTVFPGAVIGDNCHVGAMSLVPKGAELDGDAVYGGVPVRKIRDLRKGGKSRIMQGSDPEALATALEST